MSDSLLCRFIRHDWRIISIALAGHDSNRTRRCDRCFDRGRLLLEQQALGYWGDDIGAPWLPERDERGSIIEGRFVEC